MKSSLTVSSVPSRTINWGWVQLSAIVFGTCHVSRSRCQHQQSDVALLEDRSLTGCRRGAQRRCNRAKVRTRHRLGGTLGPGPHRDQSCGPNSRTGPLQIVFDHRRIHQLQIFVEFWSAAMKGVWSFQYNWNCLISLVFLISIFLKIECLQYNVTFE